MPLPTFQANNTPHSPACVRSRLKYALCASSRRVFDASVKALRARTAGGVSAYSRPPHLPACVRSRLKYQKAAGRFKTCPPLFGTPAGNRTRNGPLGGGCYIHLTTEARSLFLLLFYYKFPKKANTLPTVNKILLKSRAEKSAREIFLLD